ncbi:hypothetical protein EIKCOROL_02451 [Eikenella corrodens ATCC 23834]|uniref:Uncharacterized protein n=1 Tax=Eikenella corrodens ATCC 23834 TaxID=546274 RepID=C0DYI7_EIKCO|nr:hypothetical protein EIKCOROL_02451 [Eikenella corrodens ATCC 23834]
MQSAHYIAKRQTSPPPSTHMVHKNTYYQYKTIYYLLSAILGSKLA